jgi:hypothetical protein
MTGRHSTEYADGYAISKPRRLEDRHPIAAGELMLSRMRNYCWIEIRGETQHTAKLTPAGLKLMRSAI